MNKIAVILLLILGLLAFTVKESYAYWSSNQISNTSIANSMTISGMWNQIYEWDPNTTYKTGDIVYFNGSTYIATKNNPPFSPGDTRGAKFWDLVI